MELAKPPASIIFFFLNDPAPTKIYTLPLHAALPISTFRKQLDAAQPRRWCRLLEVPQKQHSAPPQWAGRWQPSRRLGLAARPDQVVCPVLAFAFDQAGIDRGRE